MPSASSDKLRRLRLMKILAIALLLSALAFKGCPLRAQESDAQLRLSVTDPSGLGVRAAVELTSDANHFSRITGTNDTGQLLIRRLPYGVYRIQVRQKGFAPASRVVELQSSLPVTLKIQLEVATVSTEVTVQGSTLMDPEEVASNTQIGTHFIEDRPASLPGRSVQDLVNTQPGWLYEGNAVLHPRGSEYQTQLVIDGIPLTDNRSPGFAPEIDADDLESMNVFTAGIPAEYGRKMGGVVEMTTEENSQAGFHGRSVLSGGSFNSLSGFVEAQYVEGKNFFGASVEGANTEHYLNPVVPENFTNTGTTGDFSLSYERQFTQKDRLTLSVRHELSRFEIPNEQIQQSAGQLQNADNFETMGIVSYEHIFSPDVVSYFGAWCATIPAGCGPTPSLRQSSPFKTIIFERDISKDRSPYITEFTSSRRESNPTIFSCTRISATESPIPRNSMMARRCHLLFWEAIPTWSNLPLCRI